MRVCIGWLILLGQFVPSGGAQSAGEVVLALECTRSPCRFRQGEAIHLELDITAATTGYSVQDGLQVGDGLAMRESGRESFAAAPSDCIGDPLEGSTIMRAGSGIFGTPPLLPGKPFSMTVELNQWIRFGCPGKYQLTARSTRAYWKADEAMAFQHPQSIVSRPMEIEIVPADGDWQKEQLARIIRELPAPGAAFSTEATAAVRALGYLGSDDALREIRRHVSEAPLSQDFRQQNAFYTVEWEMARLELLRRAAPRR